MLNDISLCSSRSIRIYSIQWRLLYALPCFGNPVLRRQHVMLSEDRPRKHTLFPSPIPLAFAPNPLRAAPYLLHLIYREVYRQACPELRPFMPVAEDPSSLLALVSAIDQCTHSTRMEANILGQRSLMGLVDTLRYKISSFCIY